MSREKKIVEGAVDKMDRCFYCEHEGRHHHDVKTLFIPMLKKHYNSGIKKVCRECIELKGFGEVIEYTEIVQLKNGLIEEI